MSLFLNFPGLNHITTYQIRRQVGREEEREGERNITKKGKKKRRKEREKKRFCSIQNSGQKFENILYKNPEAR